MNEGLGKFTCDFYHKFNKEENLFFSGYSISSAVALAYLGAKGETKNQIAEALGYTPDAPQVVQALMDLGTALNTSDGKIESKVGNAVWVQEGLNLTEEFLKASEEISEFVRKVDYESAHEAARKEINKWVAEKTNDMIKDLIPEGALDASIKLVLTNAIYFNGKWAKEFDSNNTLEMSFFNLDGTESKVDSMLELKTKCRYFENENLQFAALPYGDEHGSVAEMHIILPKQDCFEKVDKAIDYAPLKLLSDIAMVEDDVRLRLPKFKLTYKDDITSKLAEDMPLAFSDIADFSGLSSETDLKISSVIHEAVVDVTEKGTEAVAATALMMMEYCAMAKMPTSFIVNRPFIFTIWNKKDEVPMFMGRVTRL